MSKTLYKYTPEQTARMRQEVVARIARSVGEAFKRHPELRSAVMLVSQFWNDEADDAVHCDLIFSKLAEPDIEAVDKEREDEDSEDGDPTNLPEGVSHTDLDLAVNGLIWRYDENAFPLSSTFTWDSNGDAIPLFAAFTKEGCDQGMSLVESGAPYAMFRRSPTGVETELVGELRRPWLDGVKPEWEHGSAD